MSKLMTAFVLGCVLLLQSSPTLAEHIFDSFRKSPNLLHYYQAHVEGPLEERSIWSSVRPHLKTMEACFSPSKTKVTPLKAFTFLLHVDELGNVLESTLDRPRRVNKRTRGCLRDHLSKLRFAKAKRSSKVKLELLRGNDNCELYGKMSPFGRDSGKISPEEIEPLSSKARDDLKHRPPPPNSTKGPSGIGTICLGTLADIAPGGGGGQGMGFDPKRHAFRARPRNPIRDINLDRGAPIIRGALEDRDVRRVFYERRDQLKRCYLSEYEKGFKRRGTVNTRFVVSSRGRVAVAMVKSSTLNNSAIEKCIEGVILGMQFRAPTDGGVADVQFPLTFSVDP